MSELVEGVSEAVRQALCAPTQCVEFCLYAPCACADAIAQAVTAHILAEAAKVARERSKGPRDMADNIARDIERLAE